MKVQPEMKHSLTQEDHRLLSLVMSTEARAVRDQAEGPYPLLHGDPKDWVPVGDTAATHLGGAGCRLAIGMHSRSRHGDCPRWQSLSAAAWHFAIGPSTVAAGLVASYSDLNVAGWMLVGSMRRSMLGYGGTIAPGGAAGHAEAKSQHYSVVCLDLAGILLHCSLAEKWRI